jgi:hypothetical protein
MRRITLRHRRRRYWRRYGVHDGCCNFGTVAYQP